MPTVRGELEEILNGTEGVTAAVDFMNMTVTLSCESPAARERAIYAINHFEDVRVAEDLPGKPAAKGLLRQHLREIVQGVMVSVACFIPAMILYFAGGNTGRIISYPLFAVSYLSVGWEVIANTVKNISKGRIFDENFLMTVASVAAVVLGIVSGDGLYEGVAVMLLYQIGELLQSVAVGSSRNSITKLMDLRSDTATLLKGGEQVTVRPEELEAGDVILIKAGEKVPVDGVIVKGESALDMRSLNGESLPVEVGEGQEILSGAINVSGALEVKVLRRYCDSAGGKDTRPRGKFHCKEGEARKVHNKVRPILHPCGVRRRTRRGRAGAHGHLCGERSVRLADIFGVDLEGAFVPRNKLPVRAGHFGAALLLRRHRPRGKVGHTRKGFHLPGRTRAVQGGGVR